MWTEFYEDFDVFYGKYLENQRMFSENHEVLSQPLTPPPENAYTVSCLPWVSFRHFAVHTHDNKDYFFPSVEAGKIYEDTNDRKMLPLSLTCHHATTDGYHVDQFLKSLQNEMSAFCLALK